MLFRALMIGGGIKDVVDRLYWHAGTNIQDVYNGRDTTWRGWIRVTLESEYEL